MNRTLHCLGTGGWLPSSERETSCYAVRDGTRLLVLDAGTGLRRLATDPGLCAGVDRIDIVLSHFHLDHVVGLSYLDALGPAVERHVWGPGAWLYGRSTRAVVEQLTGAPYGSAPTGELFHDVHELTAATAEVAGHPVRVRAQLTHSHPSVGFRYSDAFAYCTDTAADPGTADFVAGVPLLLHEAWTTASASPRYHCTAEQTARIAAAAGAGRLVLVHLDPRLPGESLLAEATATFPSTQLGVDSQSWPLG
ncbi:MBL fold metallo-hydrolase [Actinoplanes sp. NPDC024001]|uniref:MBL fold metallo-hydrolase n=1 Tax=Actinoplanes sp. NPDC024001 TaxID=3154598 RepID=UPI0033C690BF